MNQEHAETESADRDQTLKDKMIVAIFEGINEARDWRAVLRRSLSIETSEMLFTSSSPSILFLGSTCCTGDTFSGYECGHRTAASH